MARRRDASRLIRWLWSSSRLDARLARASLLPLAALWRSGMTVRTMAYRRGWCAARTLPLPSIAVGNLTVGGTGKTPLASWIARQYAMRGIVPAIVLRGYGGDEVEVHRQAVPAARVIASADRVVGARLAQADGAQVVVLDDAYQRLDVRRDYNIVVLSADAEPVAPWPLPAGPWREGWGALGRADAVVITRKSASRGLAARLAESVRRRVTCPVAIASLGIERFEGLVSGRSFAPERLRGRTVVAASGIGDPAAFAAQLRELGAVVTPAVWRDHHAFDAADIAWLVEAARSADHLVMTLKDAVKVRGRWPAAPPEPLVALLDLEWEEGGGEIAAALANIVIHQPEPL